jgi:hypothetical protein
MPHFRYPEVESLVVVVAVAEMPQLLPELLLRAVRVAAV